jgi:hypothetical protein
MPKAEIGCELGRCIGIQARVSGHFRVQGIAIQTELHDAERQPEGDHVAVLIVIVYVLLIEQVVGIAHA